MCCIVRVSSSRVWVAKRESDVISLILYGSKRICISIAIKLQKISSQGRSRGKSKSEYFPVFISRIISWCQSGLLHWFQHWVRWVTDLSVFKTEPELEEFVRYTGCSTFAVWYSMDYFHSHLDLLNNLITVSAWKFIFILLPGLHNLNILQCLPPVHLICSAG